MPTSINPRKGNIAVSPIFERSTYESNIVELIKPDQFKGRSTQGIVKHVGEDVKEIKEGDYVFFSAYTGTLWNIGNELLIIMGADKVKAIRDMSRDGRMVPGLYFKGVNSLNFKEKQHEILRIIYGKSYTHIDIDDGGYMHKMAKEIISICQPIYHKADYSNIIDLLAQSIDDPMTLNELNPNDSDNFIEDNN